MVSAYLLLALIYRSLLLHSMYGAKVKAGNVHLALKHYQFITKEKRILRKKTMPDILTQLGQ
jgi:hypothetical protein